MGTFFARFILLALFLAGTTAADPIPHSLDTLSFTTDSLSFAIK